MSILLENIHKRYDEQVVVNDVSLEVGDGEFFVLLGSSGSGKTTVLNIVAGLVNADAGRVTLHGRDVTGLSPQERKIGFVFQSYALFQAMTVSENVEFGLSLRKVSREKRAQRRDELLDLVGLVGLGDRLPRQLSGGQQQRVALARALAVEPDVLLLDEPLGALDAKIRAELRRSLKDIQVKLGVAAILVTHDQEEAFDLADRIGVMSYGRLVEVGTPASLYQQPETEFVASFLGSANLVVGNLIQNQVQIGNHKFPINSTPIHLSTDGRVQVLFRPEDVALSGSSEGLDCAPLGKARVREIAFNGPAERLRLELPGLPGVRAIAPTPPFGGQHILIDASRAPEEARLFPLQPGDETWLGIRRLHALSHPGLRFLLVTDGSLQSQSALQQGGHIARLAHARVSLLGLEDSQVDISAPLDESRKQLGSGLAALEVFRESGSAAEAVEKIVARQPADVVVLGWQPLEPLAEVENIIQAGEHHLFLATSPEIRFRKALVCVASGEPAKDDVLFSGRLLRHLGMEATLLSIVSPTAGNDFEAERVQRFLARGQETLNQFDVKSETRIRAANPLHGILQELEEGEYDLVILGAPLPNRTGALLLDGLVQNVLRLARDCSFLIIRSRYFADARPRLD